MNGDGGGFVAHWDETAGELRIGPPPSALVGPAYDSADEMFAALDQLGDADPAAELRATLDAIANRMCSDVRDWSRYHRDAWLYGVFVGWGNGAALAEVVAEHNWNVEDVLNLARHRAVIARYQTPHDDITDDELADGPGE